MSEQVSIFITEDSEINESSINHPSTNLFNYGKTAELKLIKAAVSVSATEIQVDSFWAMHASFL